jgi:hypothetical protein
MYTGSLIDDLIATVERAENSVRGEMQQESASETWCAIVPTEIFTFEVPSQLAGVA